ncbi:nitroreductase family protein [Fibrobacterota bacterium]
MNFLELAKTRCSIRKYKDQPVEEEKLKAVLEAGRIAPSAVNYQPWYFIVVREQELRKKVAATYGREWINQAPVILVICGDHSKSWRRGDGKDHCDIDVAIAIDHMTLAAAELGLGSCWVCKFNAMQCSELLKLPVHLETIALLPIGYPAGERDDKDIERHLKRKTLEEVAHWDGFKC